MADTWQVSALQLHQSRRERALYSRGRLSDFLIAAYLCVFITVGFAFASERVIHWFVLPVLLCGILIGADAVYWMRGRFVFDPVGVIGLVGFHMFFMAPLLHVVWDHWMRYIVPPPDWRPWLGGMAILNAIGLVIYRISRGWLNPQWRRGLQVWHLDRAKFLTLVGVGLLLTGGLQYWVYTRYGGIFGYILEYVSRTGGFVGMGWIFTLSESFPILALMGFSVYAQRKRWSRSWFVIGVVLAIYWALLLLFGGFRGSRSNTVWGVFWAVGVIHFWIRPLSKRAILLGVLLIISFMYLYGFYKGAGLESLRALSPATRPMLEEQTGRTLKSVLLDDLARSDVQAFLLYRLTGEDADYEYALGRTYLGGMTILIPRAIWPQRPPTKVKEGTEAQYGMGSYVPDHWVSSRVYGLAGEAMLNFGPLAVPFAFAVLGLAVGLVRRLFINLQPGDARLLLYPFLVNLCLVILVGDSDNVVFFLIKNGSVPLLLLTLASRRRPAL
jgi:hypothetical protein